MKHITTKKILVTLFSALLLAGACFTASAQSSDEKSEKEYRYPFQEAKISYRNVTVYKVLDHKDAYIVMYAKGHKDIGTCTVPKKWYSESPSKLSFRKLGTGMSPYMTIISRDGNFDKVILTMPVSRANPAWAVADSNTQVDASGDTLNIVY